MTIIETAAPISMDNLKLYFKDKDNTQFLITNSDLANDKLINYLSNIGIPFDLAVIDNDILKAYLESEYVIKCKALEEATSVILLEYKGLIDTNIHEEFISNNLEIVQKWASILDSLTIYNMYIIQDKSIQKYATDFPTDSGTIGINFVNILTEDFYTSYFNSIDRSSLKFYDRFFKGPLSAKIELYTKWATENNPLFLITWAVASGTYSQIR
jgi:hypothetical protein